MINRELSTSAPGPARTRAIGRNHTLWSLLVKDLSLAENQLPAEMKAQLIGLGLWSMHYSTLALLRDIPVEPLVAVNENVLQGLLDQALNSTPSSVPAAPFSA
jgi:flagellar protein FlaF